MKQSSLHNNSVFAGFLYDKDSASVVDRAGHPLKLRPQTVDVFRVLAESPDQLVTRERLFNTVWSDIHVTDDSLTKCISEIRKAIGDEKHEVLRTVPKRGYILVKDSQSTDSPVVTGHTKSNRFCRYLPLRKNILLIFVTSCFLVALLLFFQPDNWQGGALDGQPSIAVIPFSTLSDEGRWRRMAEGLSSNLLAELARNEWLRVYQFQNGDQWQQYSEDGNAIQFLLDGTFQGEDETIRVTAKLRNVSSKEVVWSGHWKQPVLDLFSVQDEILAKIGNSMGSAWSGVLAQHSLENARRRPTESLSAYELYLLGNEHKHRFNEDDYKLAIDYLEHI